MQVVFGPAPKNFVVPVGTPEANMVKELAEFSAKKENWWRTNGEGDVGIKDPTLFTRHVKVPCAGGHDHHIAHIIFTHTVGVLATAQGKVIQDELVIRHATIGIDDYMSHPDPIQIQVVAGWLGFTGGPQNWHMEMHPQWVNVVVVTQPVEPVPNSRGKILPRMLTAQGGRRDEFWPRQDLANDPKGQEQAHNLARSIRLRRALDKAGLETNSIKSLMDIWFNKPLKSHEPVPVEKLATTPLDLTEEEKEVFVELRKRVLGY